MKATQLFISEAGYIYAHPRSKQGGIRNLRAWGHISELLAQRSPRGRLVRRWWGRYLQRIGCYQKEDRSARIGAAFSVPR